MKKQFTLMAMFAAMMVFTFSSCESEKEVEDTSNSDELVAINAQYVDNVVLPTYDSLANASINLYNAVVALQEDKTDANVEKVAALWKSTRVFWEESEAFLFGPVDVLGIDPHIDTWPMNESAYLEVLNDESVISSLNSSDGDELVSQISEQSDGLLGFHSLEYTFFRDGSVRAASDISTNEMILAVAVAGDLRNECCLILAGWEGESAIGSTRAGYAQRTSNYDGLATYYSTPYATTMKTTPNDSYSSALSSTAAILDGAIDIADEVASAKIGQPYYGASDDDKNYIESKYSYNSKVDFAGNIRSVKNAYLGAIGSSNSASVSTYLSAKNSTLDSEVKSAITDAIEKIDAMEDFETNATGSTTALAAMEACQALMDQLELAKAALSE
ncbi:MAG: peptidase [Bacteroidetes bacterium]|nr:peptidase [Bacteroidota bacterium]